MSIVTTSVPEATEVLPATSVWMARMLCAPSPSAEEVMLHVPPATVAVPRLSPASTTPLVFTSSKSVTVAPFSPVPVKTGGLAGSDWIISEGLKGGEQVVVNGLQKARPGMPVKAVPVGGVTKAPAPVPAKSAPAGK